MKDLRSTIKPFEPFILAFLLTSVATALRLWPLEVLGDRFIWSSFYPAVVLSAIYGGLYSGLFSTLLSCLVCYSGWHSFSGHSFKQDNAGLVGMMVFILNGILISIVAEALKKSREKNARINNALEDKIAQLNALSNNLPDSFIYQVATNAAGIQEIIYVSNGVTKFIEADEKQIVRNPGLLYQLIWEEDRKLFLNERNKAAGEVRALQVDTRFYKRDGTCGWASIHAKPRKTEEGELVWDGLFTDITPRVLLENELNRQQLRSQRLLTEMAIQEHEDEKNQVSYELHEEINQLLAAAKMHLELGKSIMNVADDTVATSLACLNQAIEKTNILFESIDAPTFGLFGLADRIELLARELLQKNNHLVYLNFHADAVNSLPDKIKLLLYRIIKNRLLYIRDNADAGDVDITVETGSDLLRLLISYGGDAYNADPDHWSTDLRKIQSRVEFYGGSINVSQNENNWCTLQISLPTVAEML